MFVLACCLALTEGELNPVEQVALAKVFEGLGETVVCWSMVAHLHKGCASSSKCTFDANDGCNSTGITCDEESVVKM